MSRPTVLVAGVGNIFLGDDGFGVEVAQRLASVPLPPQVELADFGIRGVHLAYELLDGYDTVILIDAVSRGDAPGTISVLEADTHPEGQGEAVMDAHNLDPGAVLALLADLGGHVDRLLVVGCEPASVEEAMGLSAPVAAAVDEAIGVVVELVEHALGAGKESIR